MYKALELDCQLCETTFMYLLRASDHFWNEVTIKIQSSFYVILSLLAAKQMYMSLCKLSLALQSN